MHILALLFENCYFEIFFEAMENNAEYLAELFVKVVKSTLLLTIPRLTDVLPRLTSIDPDLRAVSVKYVAKFPWSHLFHNWCYSKLVNKISHKVHLTDSSCSIDENEKKTNSKIHSKIIQGSKLLEIVMDGDEHVLNQLNECTIEHCRIYIIDVVAAKYNLSTSCKAEAIADFVFCMFSICKWDVSIAAIESILYFLSDVLTKYADMLKACQDDSVIAQLRTLLTKENDIRLSDYICLLLSHFISFSSSNICIFICVTEKDWSHTVADLELVEGATPVILQFAKDWYEENDSKEYEAILSICCRAQMQTLGVKHLGKGNVLVCMMSLSENGWLKDKTTIADLLRCVFEKGKLALDKRPHFIRDLLTTVKSIEGLDTSQKQEMYRSVLTELFQKAQDLVPGARKEKDTICLQILEELVQNQWNTQKFTLESDDSVLLNRVLEKFDAIVAQAAKLLGYFGQTNKSYQYSLHIWFLKQFYVAKGMSFTRSLISEEHLYQKIPIFADPLLSSAFYNLKYPQQNFSSIDPFIGIYQAKYTNFSQKIRQGIQSGSVDNIGYMGDKKDFVPLLAATLSLANLSATYLSQNFQSYRTYICTYIFFDVSFATYT
ncbi:hypothetical protein RFI_30797 [Reticulomyxa filosa]|uniref:Uncharacterized protein n=1 Tax=Reticulomyxa filosa TaxID=46433 RepID=X6LY94_RETFI|nr:hypothetical protein RFI_30797 [Reticulomyxa filosa]|eukprot:ETO06594.1 hypothetical protein RFI_30797 [Reticulomyxa filosa]